METRERWQTRVMNADLRQRTGGVGEPVLLLLHGMGATSDVWSRCEALLRRDWPGRWAAPDLPGHGGSPRLDSYTFDEVAARVADDLRRSRDEYRDIVVLGHSLGGVVGLALAGTATDIRVRTVIGLGIKTRWSEADLARAKDLAQRPPTWFSSRDEAAARHLRVSGLADLLSVDDPAVDPGLQAEDGRWRLAMDPAVFAIGAPDMHGLLTHARTKVLLARGEHDAMVTDEDLAQLGTPVATLPGVGHNAHVESPESVVPLCLAAL
jgi:pimeloyl-ACP methyl ester carboxylesterase